MRGRGRYAELMGAGMEVCAIRSNKRRRGAASVDVAVSFGVFIFMLFFVIQTALAFQDHETLVNMTREVARGLATGDSISGAKVRANHFDQGIIPTPNTTINYTLQFSADGSTWTTVADSTPTGGNTTSNISTGSLIRVQANYAPANFPHFFGLYSNLFASAIMRRE